MRIELVDMMGQPVRHQELSWAQVYQRRMRRFNLEIISVALIALTLLITWFFL
ncbi:MAG TPA: hypothetical protein VGX93_01700 [Chthoniobacterales bacterium]|nr:hypothetical protein [Chthoniobacterales bacterium]